MQYHPDDFLRLAEEVENQGGAMLNDPCLPETYRLKVPDPDGALRWADYTTSGCLKDARFVVTYDLPAGEEGDRMAARGGGFATLCAVDDDMGKWPRFAGQMQEDSY